MRVFLLTLIAVISLPSQASDFAKEARWAEQIVDFLIDGEAEYLDANGHEFLGIYTEADDSSNKAIIVVHGIGVHPDWAQVVKPVRVEMAGLGWNTLSIQMPILPNEAASADYFPLFSDIAPRFKAAEAYLRDLGMEEIVVVAHSMGATMSSYYLARNEHGIKAFVAVGMQSTQADDNVNSAKSLESINIPVLDIYGSKDLEGVLTTAELRSRSAVGNAAYQQQVTAGAGHFYDGFEQDLIDSISSWLDSQ